MTQSSQLTQEQAWTIDATHTLVEFSVKHMMITTVKGRFGQVEGRIARSDEGSDWEISVDIDAASVDTRVQQRDDHLRSADFFDVEKYPRLTFRSTGLEGDYSAPGDTFKVLGDLTIRDVTRPVELDVTYNGSGRDPWGGDRLSFDAKTKIDRREFGLTWNQGLETGGVLVSNDVQIHLEVQVVRAG
jgi:polyisoprenoid-binding protein YceI